MSDRTDVPSVEMLHEARRAIEAVLLVATEPTPVQLLAQLIELPADAVQALCLDLAEEYETQGRGFQLVEIAGGWRYQTHPDAHPYVERFAMEGIPNRLSSAALETLAIVAYKQPISRAQIGAIRGVNVDGVLRTLSQQGYVEERGRDDGPGQATLFGTTTFFLERLGLMSLDDLPPLGDFVPSAQVLEALEQTLKVEGLDGRRPDVNATESMVATNGGAPPGTDGSAAGDASPNGSANGSGAHVQSDDGSPNGATAANGSSNGDGAAHEQADPSTDTTATNGAVATNGAHDPDEVEPAEAEAQVGIEAPSEDSADLAEDLADPSEDSADLAEDLADPSEDSAEATEVGAEEATDPSENLADAAEVVAEEPVEAEVEVDIEAPSEDSAEPADESADPAAGQDDEPGVVVEALTEDTADPAVALAVPPVIDDPASVRAEQARGNGAAPHAEPEADVPEPEQAAAEAAAEVEQPGDVAPAATEDDESFVGTQNEEIAAVRVSEETPRPLAIGAAGADDAVRFPGSDQPPDPPAVDVEDHGLEDRAAVAADPEAGTDGHGSEGHPRAGDGQDDGQDDDNAGDHRPTKPVDIDLGDIDLVAREHPTGGPDPEVDAEAEAETDDGLQARRSQADGLEAGDAPAERPGADVVGLDKADNGPGAGSAVVAPGAGQDPAAPVDMSGPGPDADGA